jgi:hypothetical protein
MYNFWIRCTGPVEDAPWHVFTAGFILVDKKHMLSLCHLTGLIF